MKNDVRDCVAFDQVLAQTERFQVSRGVHKLACFEIDGGLGAVVHESQGSGQTLVRNLANQLSQWLVCEFALHELSLWNWAAPPVPDKHHNTN